MVICGGMVTPLLPSPSLYMQVSCQQSMIQQSYEQHMHALCARMPIPFFPQDSFPFPLCFAGRRLTTALLTRETEEAPPRLLLQHRRPSCHGTPGKEDQRVWMLPPPPLFSQALRTSLAAKEGQDEEGRKGNHEKRQGKNRKDSSSSSSSSSSSRRARREGGRAAALKVRTVLLPYYSRRTLYDRHYYYYYLQQQRLSSFLLLFPQFWKTGGGRRPFPCVMMMPVRAKVGQTYNVPTRASCSSSFLLVRFFPWFPPSPS